MKSTTNVAEQPELQSVEEWLRSLLRAQRVSRAINDVVQAAISDPELASYASAFEFSQAAKVNVATVTRSAQALGFTGWPELRQEIRTRFVGALSAPEVAIVHSAHSSGRPFQDALSRDAESLAMVRRIVDANQVREFSAVIAGSRRRVVVAAGSVAAIARAFAHNAGLAGYRSELAYDSVTASNAVADFGPGDVLIAVSFWRLYRFTSIAVRQAKSLGASVCVLTDSAASPLVALADRVIIVPAEGVSFFPSLVPGLAVVQGICAELASIDPDRTQRSIAAAEEQWKAFGLLHFGRDSS